MSYCFKRTILAKYA